LEPEKHHSQISDKWLEQQEPEAVDLWKRVLTEVKERISQPSFFTWFQGTKAIQIEQDTIIVYIPNHIARDWLYSRYASLVKECMDTLEIDVKTVEFV
jgi:chromosomal replication initiator protein